MKKIISLLVISVLWVGVVSNAFCEEDKKPAPMAQERDGTFERDLRRQLLKSASSELSIAIQLYKGDQLFPPWNADHLGSAWNSARIINLITSVNDSEIRAPKEEEVFGVSSSGVKEKRLFYYGHDNDKKSFYLIALPLFYETFSGTKEDIQISLLREALHSAWNKHDTDSDEAGWLAKLIFNHLFSTPTAPGENTQINIIEDLVDACYEVPLIGKLWTDELRSLHNAMSNGSYTDKGYMNYSYNYTEKATYLRSVYINGKLDSQTQVVKIALKTKDFSQRIYHQDIAWREISEATAAIWGQLSNFIRSLKKCPEDPEVIRKRAEEEAKQAAIKDGPKK